MDFVTGGACQGKSTWAAKKYCLEKGFYCITTLDLLRKENPIGDILIIENVEQSIKNIEDLENAKQQIKELEKWETGKNNRKVVFIGAQIGSGIVPIEPEYREWRDNLGFFYQELVQKCSNVYRIWAGIPEQLKGKI